MPNPKNSGKHAPKKTWTKQRGEDLLLPSGNTAKVKRPGPEALLKKGILPDALASLVNDMIATGKGMKKEDQSALAADPEAVLGMMDAMDKVLVTVCLEPKVLYHKDDAGNVIPDDDREDEIYSDDVEFEDKSFIFNFAVGGTRDIARFRRETGISLGDAPSLEGSGDSAE